MAQWAGAQVAATVWLTSNRQLEGTIGRVADTAHTGSFITRHNHFQPSVDSHRAINTNDIQLIPVYITVKYGESQDKSSSHLETRGLR